MAGLNNTRIGAAISRRAETHRAWVGERHGLVGQARGASAVIGERLDRLGWSPFHTLLVFALGVTWVLDGLEVTIVGSIGPALKSAAALSLSDAQIGAAASAYVLGAVLGALGFGWLTDRYGRKPMFAITLGLYVLGVGCSALSMDHLSFDAARLLTGLGIGGEYAAINSAIDEMIPARLRGRVDLAVNGSYWLGAAMGAAGSLVLMNPDVFPTWLGWRLGFAIGGVLGLGVIALRRHVPESPRWLALHGETGQAAQVLAEIESRATGQAVDPVALPPPRRFATGLLALLHAMATTHRTRSLYVLVLMIAQAFLYNAVFFTYGLVLNRYEGVPESSIGLYILPLALTNFAGPVLLGRLFDTIGRRRMIAITYAIPAVLMAAVAAALYAGALTATTQTIGWMAVFFFASAAASSAYLTASEIFPPESRALAIALFYAFGTILGGVGAPLLFGWLIGLGTVGPVVGGYLAAAALMAAAAIAALVIGVDAEGKSLEELAL